MTVPLPPTHPFHTPSRKLLHRDKLCMRTIAQRVMIVLATTLLPTVLIPIFAQAQKAALQIPMTYEDSILASSHTTDQNGSGASPVFLDSTAPAGHPRMKDVRADFSHIGYMDSVGAPAGATDTTPLRVLFIGNSLTYYHEMPRIFMSLAAAGERRRVVVGLVSWPGLSVEQITGLTDVNGVVKRFPWSYIVLQQKPQPSMIEGYRVYLQGMPMSSWTIDDNVEIVKHFLQADADSHAHVALWDQYYMPDLGHAGQQVIDSLVGGAARATGVPYIPVGAVWDRVGRTDSATWYHLYQSWVPGKAISNYHPSFLGSYLVALAIYQTITGRSPVGLPNTIEGVRLPHSVGTLTIPAATAALLQHAVAEEAIQTAGRADTTITGSDTAEEGLKFPVVGKPAPPLMLTRWLNRTDASPISFGDGHVYVLNFTAMWCGPCKEVYPKLNALQAQFASKGLRVIYGTVLDGMGEDFMVPVARDKEIALLPEYFAKHNITAPVAVFDSVKDELWRKYSDIGDGSMEIPKTVVIDGSGVIRDVIRGPDVNKRLIADLDRLLPVAQGGGKPATLGLEGLGTLLGQVLQKQLQNRITLSLKESLLDAKRNSTTLTIMNLGPDTLDLTLEMRQSPPVQGAEQGAEHGDTSGNTAMNVATVGDTTHPLTDWVTGLPESLRLLPHAVQQVKLYVNAPTATQARLYTGWVVVTSHAWSSGDTAGGLRISVEPQISFAKLAYQVR